MQVAITLVTAPTAWDMLEPAAAAVRAAVADLDAPPAAERRLGRPALDLIVEGADPVALKTTLGAVLAPLPVDLLIQDAGARDRKLLLADMDSTMVTGETLDEIAVAAGIGDKVIPITERAMRGELDFEGALRERVGLLADRPWSLVEGVLAATDLSPGAAVAVKTLAAHGVRCVLISGGFTVFTGEIARRCGFHDHESNVLGRDGDRLTGTVEGPIVGRPRKRARLEEEAARLGVGLDRAIAIGDGANDLAMIRAAGLGVGWRPKPAVAAEADAVLAHADLTALCYAMGIPKSDFAAE